MDQPSIPQTSHPRRDPPHPESAVTLQDDKSALSTVKVTKTQNSRELILFYFKNKKRSDGSKDATISEDHQCFYVTFPDTQGK
jgi:hypothetical protein